MLELRTAHTADLAAADLDEIRALLTAAFEEPFPDDDWEHTLGGMHALLHEGGMLVAHASVVQRRLIYEGHALRAGYVEGVGVHPDHQRRGHGARVMDALERVIRGAYDLGALATTDAAVPFYRARGWTGWTGETFALTPSGTVRTADVDGGIFVLPVTLDLDITRPLTCDWRDGELW